MPKIPKTIVTVLKQGTTNEMIRKLQRAGYCVVVVESHDALQVTRVHETPVLPPDQVLTVALAVIAGDDSHDRHYLKRFAKGIISLLQERGTSP